ncbi:MAG TPA: DUF2892 domain-containing protein [Solirubrobacteraceae bacterium]|nr:DUF2892 domain-containing protein [Solirubrobacteraceae bacterium]
MGFVAFMRSSSGRLVRIVAGAALILIGLLVVGGAGGIVIAVVGLVPLLAGIFNFCLFGPLLGTDFWGRTSRRHV